MKLRLLAAAAALCASAFLASGQLDYKLETTVNAGSGDFAPYYTAANVHGVVNSPLSAYERATAWRSLDLGQRFSWGMGVDVLAGAGKGVDYAKFHAATQTWSQHNMKPANVWLQQLYGEVKYRGCFLTVGMKEYDSGLLSNTLSSGDLTYSGNIRPMPGFRCGFIDFQDIPFTNGWVQIQGEFGYAKMLDEDWAKDHFNFYSGHYTTGQWFNYKRCYFRTNPDQPLSVTAGMQAAAQFCGTTYVYAMGDYAPGKYGNGVLTNTIRHPLTLSYFLKAFVPSNGEDYKPGAHTGSWDFKARYRLRSGAQVSAYFQWPWEDGSGIGKLNGWDGLWGLEYKSADCQAIVTGAVLEYFDFRNQSGPIHWSPDDNPGTTVTSHATGGDNYYNNNVTNGYAYYGRSIGTPLLLSPFYSLMGQNMFTCNRMRGFHLGVEGCLSARLSWRALFSYRKGWGRYAQPYLTPRTDTSAMLECRWQALPALHVKAQLALDSGKLYGDNFGVLASVAYTGNFNFSRR